MRSSLKHHELKTRPQKSISGRIFTISRLHSEAAARFSCVVSKKVASRAVDRNKIRRRVRSAFPKSGTLGLYIIHIKKPALEATFAEIREDLQTLLKRLAQK